MVLKVGTSSFGTFEGSNTCIQSFGQFQLLLGIFLAGSFPIVLTDILDLLHSSRYLQIFGPLHGNN